jgi:acetoin utilization protein AcuB
MTFIVIGPGVHDPIHVDSLFGRRPVQRVGKLSPRPRIEPHGPVDVAERYAELLLRRERGQAFDAYQQVEALHEKKPVVAARQIMSSPVVALTRQATVDEAVTLIHARRFRHVPVTADDERYERQREVADGKDRVTSLMRSPVLTAAEDTDVRQIARLFVEYHIGAVPVLAGNDVVGIISRSDVLRAVMLHYGLELWV